MQNNILNAILLAKEIRSQLKEKLIMANKICVSLSLNIPGYPKTSLEIKNFFEIIHSELIFYLKARLIELDNKSLLSDEAGDYFLASINSHLSAKDIKLLCESFEGNHKLGRFIDVDITDENGNYISSGKAKPCFYCNTYSAINCMRAKRHNFDELREFQLKEILNYIAQKNKISICKDLASKALRAILYEISLTPKPGLVDFSNSGTHKDMDYFTFLDSSSAISLYFQDISELGFSFENSLSDALPKIREIGLQMENKMFGATKGVNTQKGNIFLMGIALFCSAFIKSKQGIFNLEQFSQISQALGKHLMDEFDISTENKTHGQKCVEKYGKEVAGGARLEVASGFKTSIKFGLSVFNNVDLNELNQSAKQDMLQNALLSLMANNNDTNILFRSNFETLSEFKELALKTLSSKIAEEKALKFQELMYFCYNKKISPGGSADLLAIAIFLNFINKK
ncbi:MAG: triphosphoribosyl-dephospho-CoA synthase [Bacteroidota bacterium]